MQPIFMCSIILFFKLETAFAVFNIQIIRTLLINYSTDNNDINNNGT